jgi:hypothetical protein
VRSVGWSPRPLVPGYPVWTNELVPKYLVQTNDDCHRDR